MTFHLSSVLARLTYVFTSPFQYIFLDPEIALPNDNELNEGEEENWMEFLPIGQSLLERMERCHSSLEPIVTAPD